MIGPKGEHMKKPAAWAALGILGTAAFFLFASCSPSVILTVKDEAAGTALFTADMSPTAENLVRRFSGTADTASGSGGGFFDKDKITLSLAHAGVKVDSISFPSRTGLAVSLSFLKLDGILSRAVILEKNAGRIELRLSRETVNAAVALMPAETMDYLDLLMAPVFTGETMDPAGYESVVGAAYGKTLAAELKKSAFTLTVRCPSAVKNAAIGKPATAAVTESTAVFTIPLAALLAMEQPITALAEW